MVKRYGFLQPDEGKRYDGQMREKPNGEFVRYDDLKDTILNTILTVDLGWKGAALVHFRWVDQNNVVRETNVGVEVPSNKSDQTEGLTIRVGPGHEVKV